MNSWIDLSEERLAANFRAIAQAAGAETDVLAVVKANAYGHGAETSALTLAQAGAKWLGVASASEGARVRAALDAAGWSGDGAPRILVMCGVMPEDVAAIAEHRLTPAIWTADQAAWLAGSGAQVHLEIDTGMCRQGVRSGAALDALLDAMAAAGLALDGILTHFSSAEVAGAEATQTQQRRFQAAMHQVRQRGLRPPWVHAGSSSSLDNPVASDGPQWLVELAKTVGARAMVRCGIALYGYCLPIQPTRQQAGNDASPSPPALQPELRPVMTWKTRIVDLREIAPGETIGYNATFTAPAAMRLALLPVGYADGLRRELSSTNAQPGGWVVLRGRDGSGGQVERRAPIVGRISMNLTTVDVTGIDGLRTGDEVILLGDGITADDHARLAATISYEILCGVRADVAHGAT